MLFTLFLVVIILGAVRGGTFVDNTPVVIGAAAQLQTVKLYPSRDEMMNSGSRGTRFVKIDQLGAHDKACVVVYVDDSHILGCVGAETVCMAIPGMSDCMARTSPDMTVSVINSFDVLTLVSMARDPTSYTITTHKQMDTGNPCPLFTWVFNDDGNIVLSTEGAGLFTAYTEDAKTMRVFTSRTVFDIPTTHTASKMCMFVMSSDHACITTVCVPLERIRAGQLFDADFNVYMNPPLRVASLSDLVISPHIDAVFFLVTYSVYEQLDKTQRVLVQTKSINTAVTPYQYPVFVDLVSCEGLHVIVLNIMYLDGTVLFNYEKTFDPVVFCLQHGLNVDCFCDNASGMTRTSRMSDYFGLTSVTVVDPAVSNTATVTSSVDSETARSSICYALDMHIGTRTDAVGTSSSCSLLLPAGVYAVFHQLDDDLNTTHAYPQVIVCTLGTPSAVHVRDDVNNFAYIRVDDGIACPPRVTSADVITSEYVTHVTPSGTVLFPAVGHYEFYVSRSYLSGSGTVHADPVSVHADVSTAIDNVPVYCADVTASLTYNHLPLFLTDHTSVATITISDADSALGVVWSLLVTENGVERNWMLMRGRTTTVDIVADVLYKFTAMRMQYAPGNSLIVDTLCYVHVGEISPIDKLEIHVRSPINVLSCTSDDETSTLIVFSITSNYPDIIDTVVPFSSFPVDRYSDSAFVYIAGPIDLANYVPGSLVLQFKIGSRGQYVVHTIDEMIMHEYYPPVSAVRIDVRDVGRASDEFVCGEYNDAPVVTVHNPTVLDVSVQHMDMYVLAGIDAKDSTILRDHCRVVAIKHQHPPVIPLDVSMGLVQDMPLANDANICNGKRYFRFSLPALTDIASFTYRTENDEDLGSVIIVNNAVFPVSVTRAASIILHVYYNPVAATAGVKLACTVTLPPPSAMQLMWFFRMPVLALQSAIDEQCELDSALDTTHNTPQKKRHAESSKHAKGGVIVKLVDSGREIHQNQIVFTSTVDGVDIMYRGYPDAPSDDVYVYSGLASGAFQATLTTTDTIMQYTCHQSSFFYVESTSSSLLAELVDMNRTYHGDKHTLCPADMYTDTEQSWLEYYMIFFNSETLRRVANAGLIVKLAMWKAGVGTPMLTGVAITASTYTYRIPGPGTYTAEISVADAHGTHKCIKHLPSYRVEDPMFSASSFVMEVLQYPTCMSSNDGIYRISYPPELDVLANIDACAHYFDPTKTCVNTITVDSATRGLVLISNAPFVIRLGMWYEITGACYFETVYSVAPPINSHPVLQRIAYVPTCDYMHSFQPVFVEAHTSNDIAYLWEVSTDEEASTEPVMYFAPSIIDQSATVTLTITYNGVCTQTTSALISDYALRVPPVVTIDKILFGLQSRSLPVHCPGGADAMLVADIYPPISNKGIAGSRLAWRSVDDPSMNITDTDMWSHKTTVAYALAAGTYSLSYTIGDCVAVDVVTIAPKLQYNILRHMQVESAPCDGGLAVVKLHVPETDNCETLPEISAFTFDMLTSSADRAYLPDQGSGATMFVNVPDGHVIHMLVPYTNRYRMKTPFCQSKLVVDVGKIAPWPVRALVIAPSDMFFYVPGWHADVSVVLGAGRAVFEQHDRHKCTRVVDLSADGQARRSLSDGPSAGAWTQLLEPVSQQLQCPYSRAEPVYIYNVYTVTNDRFLFTQIDNPLNFRSMLLAIDPAFDIVVPPVIEVIESYVIDPLCHMSPLMKIALVISDDVIHNVHVQMGAITVDGRRIETCEVQSTDTIVCNVPRTSVFYMTIPYTSDTNGSCNMRYEIYHLAEAAREYVPLVDVMSDGGQACINSGDSTDPGRCVNITDGNGMYVFKSTDDACIFSLLLPVNIGVMSGLAEPVQVMHPSCRGMDDGGIVWKLSNGTVITMTGLDAGPHFVSDNNVMSSDTVFMSTVLREPADISFIIQPSSLPPPVFYANAASIIGIPPSMISPLPISIYIAGASELLIVDITHTHLLTKQTTTNRCVVEYYSNIYWTYVCHSELLPGYSCGFSIYCPNQPAMRRRATDASVVISTLPKLELVVAKKTDPATILSRDGTFTISIVGGAAPFTVFNMDTPAVATKTTTRTLVYHEQSVGVHTIRVIEASGVVSSIDVKLVPVVFFEIKGVVVVGTYGCVPYISTVVRVALSENVTATAGIWNVGATEPPITLCSDSRMRAFSDILTLPSPGRWQIGICPANSLAVIALTSPFETHVMRGTMQVDFVGMSSTTDVCYDLVHGVYSYRSPHIAAGLNIVAATRTVVITIGNAPFATTRMGEFVQIDPMVPGIYRLEIVDETLCIMEISLNFRYAGVCL